MRALATFLTLVMGLNTFSPLLAAVNQDEQFIYRRSFSGTYSSTPEKVKEEILVTNAVSSEEKVKNNTAAPIPGGPEQPEVQSFTPIGMSDMVSPFTGDFSYNIPLMDIDGYPVNIAYSAGITMDQEASWVGLGWNLNPGVINRVMRGIPDDFNGSDKITKEFNMRDDWTIGVSAGVDAELLGFDEAKLLKGLSSSKFVLGAKLGIKFNNYNGFGSDISVTPTYSIAKNNKPTYNFSLGFSGASQGGPNVSPNISFQKGEAGKDPKETVTKSFNIGTSFNARAGFSGLSYSYSQSRSKDIITTKNNWSTITDDVTTSSKTFGSSFSTGQPTYMPSITMPKNSFGLTLRFKYGPDIMGFDGHAVFSGYFTKKWMKETSVSQSPYGYFYLSKGQNDENGSLDFNRENDGAFTANTPTLPIPMLTNDLFNVSGHGVSGSYRPYRNDIGFVFDPKISETSVDGSIGAEAGLGATAKVGVDIGVTYSVSQVKPWSGVSNFTKVAFNNDAVLFREANEMSINNDLSHFQSIGGFKPVEFRNSSPWTLFNKLQDRNGTVISNLDSFNKPLESKRNQPMYTLSFEEVKKGYGIQGLHPQAYDPGDGTNNHHKAQFTTLSTDGTRYIYGIAAYNISQKDVSFAVGTNKDFDNLPTYNAVRGTVPYNPSVDNSVNNKRGLDHYFNATSTPDYAHSFLLTNVLNADYVDSDGTPGPSKEDLGGYIIFDYKKTADYRWRNPVDQNAASYDEGLNTFKSDDKAHYNYGEKELWYVKTVKTKNHILIFHTSPRKDAVSVMGENGGLDVNGATMLQLDKIELFTIPEYDNGNNPNATPIKTVHFEYSYELCPNYPGNIDGGTAGKLTLKSVFFTYEGSQKGRNNRYEFNYGENYSYDLKSVDRWGCYKPRPTGSGLDVKNDAIRPSDFPYVGQSKADVDKWAAAWCMNEIKLPSGGRIEVDYESDDYQYVQNKKSMEMFKIVGVQNESATGYFITNNSSETITATTGNNRRLLVEVDPDFVVGMGVQNYIAGIENMYFRVLADFKDDRYDFVPGWAQIENVQYEATLSSAGHQYISIGLEGARLNDLGSPSYNPISIAAINFGRMQLSRVLPPSGQDLDDGVGALDLAKSLLGAFTSFEELFTGPNRALWNSEIATKIVLGKSWVRLNTIDGTKLGGGHRVKEIRMYDVWDQMTGIPNSSYHYGQQFKYQLANNQSSGVATYEPQMGNDENPWKQPQFYGTEKLLAADDKNYQESPYGEQFFPSAGVGYSMVTIRDLPRAGVQRTATGKIVHEFYTAKDFPTKVDRTTVDPLRFNLPIQALFFNLSLDHMAASQGFVVINNDMHGKPKAQRVYNEAGDKISSVEYFYKRNADGTLNNEVAMINKNGSTSPGTIGLTYEAVADFRHSRSSTTSGSLDLNFNAVILPVIIIPSILGTISQEFTTFKSASFVKVIEQFGIQDRTVAEDLGSKVETNNLAYDAETGQVLLTETATNFEDKVYSFSYPAHWVYDNMGLAFRNIDVSKTDFSPGYNFVSGVTNQLNTSNFIVGDEVIIDDLVASPIKCWVTEANATSIKLLMKNGQAVNGNYKSIKVLRSGNRNMASMSVGSVTLRDNPLDNLTSNIFEKVLQAGAVEYVEDWRTFCECFSVAGTPNYTSNPYVLGIKGTWRPKASWTHLSGRSQSFFNNNTNIRQDGMFTSFTPFFKNVGYDWLIDKQNWTYVSSVKEFSPFGQALETVDALGRSSASQFGYNQTFTTAVAANTQYRQLGYDGFEDYDYQNCADKHFKVASAAQISDTEAHTGRRSIKVTNANPTTLTAVIVQDCEDITPCNILMNVVVIGGTTPGYQINFTGGTAPYQITYEVLSGNFAVSLNPNGNGIIAQRISGNETFEIKIQVVDANGCVLTKVYRVANN